MQFSSSDEVASQIFPGSRDIPWNTSKTLAEANSIACWSCPPAKAMPNASFPALSRLFKHAPRFDRYEMKWCPSSSSTKKWGCSKLIGNIHLPDGPRSFPLARKNQKPTTFSLQLRANNSTKLSDHIYLHVYTFEITEGPMKHFKNTCWSKFHSMLVMPTSQSNAQRIISCFVSAFQTCTALR